MAERACRLSQFSSPLAADVCVSTQLNDKFPCDEQLPHFVRWSIT